MSLHNPSSTPSVEFLRECFDYSLVSGRLYWKERPLEHFKNAHGQHIFNSRYAGLLATGPRNGYLRVTVSWLGKPCRIYAHRLIWALVTGAWPPEVLDHVNLNKANNSWINLRASTQQENLRNCAVRRHNKVGLKWVKQTPSGRFAARATLDNKSVHFGTFDYPHDAHAAAVAALGGVHVQFLNAGEHVA